MAALENDFHSLVEHLEPVAYDAACIIELAAVDFAVNVLLRCFGEHRNQLLSADPHAVQRLRNLGEVLDRNPFQLDLDGLDRRAELQDPPAPPVPTRGCVVPVGSKMDEGYFLRIVCG